MSGFNFLIQDHRRPNVATVFTLSHETLRSLEQDTSQSEPLFIHEAIPEVEYEAFSPIKSTSSANARNRLDELSRALIPLLDTSLELSPLGESSRLSFLNLVTSIGIASYAGSHCHDLAPHPAFEPAEELRICINGQPALVCRKRRLACLDGFVGGPVWIFTTPNSGSHSFMLSTSVSDFANLWGPLWGIETNDRPGLLCLFTERGELTQADLPNLEVLAQEGEIPCHWKRLSHREHLQRRKEIGESITSGISPKRFLSNTSLLIGMPSPPQPGFQENQSCSRDLGETMAKISFDATLAGSHGGGWELSSRAVTVTGGHFLTVGGTQTHRSVPASTHKDRIYTILQSARGPTSLFPALRLHVGLEISLCTGNAQRTSLWEALKLSCLTSFQSYPDCDHQFGDLQSMFECICTCWNSTTQVQSVGQQGATTISTGLDEEDKSSSVHGAILSALVNLEFTGPLINGFHAYCPFADSAGLYTVQLDRRENGWVELMANNNHTSCLAVMSPRCLECYFSDHRGPIARLCSDRLSYGHDSMRYNINTAEAGSADTSRKTCFKSRSTFLRTYIQLDPTTPEENMTRINPGGTIRLWEGNKIFMGELGTLEIIRDGIIQLAVLRSHELERVKSTVEKALVHKERLDPLINSGNIVELCVTSSPNR
ncbi:MAG: hypothetical protein M1821_003400 [Bathelium mastoideum]|nr:MAG: hypothetical protein M1821_003400 [Bathelium mastoideum]